MNLEGNNYRVEVKPAELSTNLFQAFIKMAGIIVISEEALDNATMIDWLSAFESADDNKYIQ